ncbi:histidine phosphatase family protein [Saccharibacillus alkalitolerans]|uniref:Histidine phosphatase family protein n=1 Tax=Saccharibacillus alkalitolerans TaxID=2705290 RepID=A0ABX0F3L0_9BACL|nr:histidine phosphatase family protein [Saccharibacillus alkalitolerans]NGZ75212.1 histidine phosphatase family protein [Saccharibacillus alkalitolerans]
MDITFWLIRHGLKEASMGDVPLTPEGVLQARAAAYALKDRPLAAVVTSPLRRARETAAFVASASGREAQVDSRLRERANWGDVPGQTFGEFAAVWDRCTKDPDYVPPCGGDSVRLASARLGAALRHWAGLCAPGGEIAFVTHGGLITDFLACTFPEAELNAVCPNFADEQSGLVPECSLTELIAGTGGTFRLGVFADVRHLGRD